MADTYQDDISTMASTTRNRSSVPTRVSDVRTLLETLRTRRSRTDSDRQIATSVFVAFERLERENDVQGLHFYVFEGAISVYGDVLTYEQRDHVLQDLASLPGVRHVADHIRVADRRLRPFTIRPVAFETP